MTETAVVRPWSVVASAVAVTMFALGAGAVAWQPTAEQEAIGGPDAWVPITYDVKVSTDGVEQATYTMYRSTNGSTRKEHSSGKLIEITNLATGRFYRYLNGGWYAHPLRRQANNGQPFFKIARSAVAEVTSTDPRVAGIAASGVSCSFVRTLAGEDRVTKIHCPELNLLDVYSRIAHGGQVMEIVLTHLLVHEPHTTFLPPPGVVVVERTDAAGPGYISKTPSGMVIREGRLVGDQP